MSSWAGIESTPAGPPTATSGTASTASSRWMSNAGGASGANIPATGTASTSGARRVRRHQRPVISSLDAAGVMVQRNAREVLLGSALIILPGVAINLIAATLAFDRYESFSGSVVSIPELLGGARSSTGVEELFWYLGLLINSLAACLVGGYVASLATRRQMGLPVSIRAGYRGMVRRLPALVGAWVIGHCWIVLIGWMLRSIDDSGRTVIAVLGSPLVLVAITMTVTVSPAIVIERLDAVRGVRRSWRLARQSFGPLFGFTLGSVVVGVVVQYGLAYLPRLAQQTGLITFGRFGWLIEGVAGQVGRLISLPLVAIATAFMYLEVRMTREGMDIVLDADRAFGGRS
ncbi:MAG: hypothetical protein ABIR32_20690 [Ilumatobacteraceae bacterium]